MRILLAVPLIFLLILFALSNRQQVVLGLWPTDIQVAAPLSLAILVIAALFFIFGAFIAWAGTVAERRRARRAEADVRQLEAQLAAARQAGPPSLSLPAPRQRVAAH